MQEESADVNSFGYRSYRSPSWANKATTLCFWSRKGFGPPKFVIEFDVRKCFDSISHKYILDNVGTIKLNGDILEIVPRHIMNQWLTCGYILKDDPSKLFPTTGVPQGGPISPCICNIVLNCIQDYMVGRIRSTAKKPSLSQSDRLPGRGASKGVPYVFSYRGNEMFCNLPEANNPDIDRAIKSFGTNLGGYKNPALFLTEYRKEGSKVKGWTCRQLIHKMTAYDLHRRDSYEGWSFLARFADDFIVACNTQAAVEMAFAAAQEFLEPKGLEVSEEKSIVRKLPEERFTFVGFRFAIRKSHGKSKLYSFCPPERFDAFISRMDQVFGTTRNGESCFIKLNQKLRGWCNYYSSGNTKAQFQKLNWILWHRTYKYFFKKYRSLPQFRKSSTGVYTRKLSA